MKLFAPLRCSLGLLLLAVMGMAFAATAQAEEATPEEINKLITQLGSPQYIARQRAERDLLRLGFEAFDALKEAENAEDIEVAARARYIAERIEIDWSRSDDPADIKQLLSGYGAQSEEERFQRAQTLAAMATDASVRAMCRIVRFERSQELSKRVALLLLEGDSNQDATWKQRADVVRQTLGSSNRPASQWLRTRILAANSPAEALAEWNEWIAREQKDFAATSPAIVMSLMRLKVELLESMGRRDDAIAQMKEMIDLEQGDPETLAELVDWLARQQAWTVVDEVAKRFAAQFERDAYLLYVLAEVRAKQGDRDEAERVAKRAMALGGEQAEDHFRTAYRLELRGMKQWALREYTKVIEMGPPSARTAVYAAVRLSEMQHDAGNEAEAGETLQKLCDAMDKDPKVVQVVQAVRRDPGAVRSRKFFFQAAAAKNAGKFEQERKLLEEAIRHDATDADVLIAMYHAKAADEQYRRRTLELIRSAAAQFEAEIEENPDDSTPYNQYAWLIGNTQGDIDRAIRYSHKSLEIVPEAGGYLDTLGHCYFAKGDFLNAVKYQRRAVKLDAHSGLIRRKLVVFEKALAESQADADN